MTTRTVFSSPPCDAGCLGAAVKQYKQYSKALHRRVLPARVIHLVAVGVDPGDALTSRLSSRWRVRKRLRCRAWYDIRNSIRRRVNAIRALASSPKFEPGGRGWRRHSAAARLPDGVIPTPSGSHRRGSQRARISILETHDLRCQDVEPSQQVRKASIEIVGVKCSDPHDGPGASEGRAHDAGITRCEANPIHSVACFQRRSVDSREDHVDRAPRRSSRLRRARFRESPRSGRRQPSSLPRYPLRRRMACRRP